MKLNNKNLKAMIKNEIHQIDEGMFAKIRQKIFGKNKMEKLQDRVEEIIKHNIANKNPSSEFFRNTIRDLEKNDGKRTYFDSILAPLYVSETNELKDYIIDRLRNLHKETIAKQREKDRKDQIRRDQEYSDMKKRREEKEKEKRMADLDAEYARKDAYANSELGKRFAAGDDKPVQRAQGGVNSSVYWDKHYGGRPTHSAIDYDELRKLSEVKGANMKVTNQYLKSLIKEELDSIKKEIEADKQSKSENVTIEELLEAAKKSGNEDFYDKMLSASPRSDAGNLRRVHNKLYWTYQPEIGYKQFFTIIPDDVMEFIPRY